MKVDGFNQIWTTYFFDEFYLFIELKIYKKNLLFSIDFKKGCLVKVYNCPKLNIFSDFNTFVIWQYLSRPFFLD